MARTRQPASTRVAGEHEPRLLRAVAEVRPHHVHLAGAAALRRRDVARDGAGGAAGAGSRDRIAAGQAMWEMGDPHWSVVAARGDGRGSERRGVMGGVGRHCHSFVV